MSKVKSYLTHLDLIVVEVACMLYRDRGSSPPLRAQITPWHHMTSESIVQRGQNHIAPSYKQQSPNECVITYAHAVLSYSLEYEAVWHHFKREVKRR